MSTATERRNLIMTMNILAKIAAAALAVSASLFNTSPASAQSVWSTYHASSPNGTPGCGIRTTGPGIVVAFEAYAGSGSVLMGIFNSRWSGMPIGVPAETIVHVGPHSFVATGTTVRSRETGEAGVRLRIANNQIGEDFLTSFGLSHQMLIRFANGANGVDVSLRGSNQALLWMADCVQSLRAPSNPATPAAGSGRRT
jgi:hypothetical protein